MDQPLTPSQQYTLSSTLHPLSPSAPWPFPVPVRSSAQVMISDEGKEIVDTDFRFRSDLPIQAHNLDPYFWLGFTPQEKLMRRVETVPSPGDQPAGPEHELQKVPGQVETVFNQSSLDCLDLTTNQLSDSTLMNGTAGDQQNQELESILAGQIYYHYYSDQTAPSIESSLPSAHIFPSSSPSSPKSQALPSSKFQSLQPEQDKGLGIGIDDDSALESDLKGSKKLRMTPEEEGIKLRVKKGKNFKTSVLLSEAKENGAKANQLSL
ncbi:hypothetical protein BY996DRAFT_6419432 [Phakopsora pachyrhizi]|nr:hypothetical protein BY996DRAFT_6419432 [Phakopsora pachyrhizi]